MADILKMYFFRLFKDKVFWICLGIGVAVVLLDTIAYGVAQNLLKDSTNHANDLFTISSQSLGALSFMGLPSLLGPAFCFFFLTREFHDGTIRNMILSGKKRIDIYLSAVIVAFVICYLNVVIDEAFIWSFGSLFGLSTGLSDAAAVGRFFSSLGIFFILSLMFVAIAAGLCFLMPNAFGSFGIYLGFVLLLALVFVLFSTVFSSLASNGNLSASFFQTFQESMTAYQITYLEGYPSALDVAVTARFGYVALWASLEAVILGGAALFFGGWKFIRSDLK